MSAETTLLEQGAGAPTGFGNESPFKKRAKVKDPSGSALKAAGYLGVALCVIAMAMTTGM